MASVTRRRWVATRRLPPSELFESRGLVITEGFGALRGVPRHDSRPCLTWRYDAGATQVGACRKDR